MRQNKLALAVSVLLCSAMTVGTLPAMAEVNSATLAATPASATAPVVVPGSGLPELTRLIKQNSSAVVNISVEGGSMARALPDGLPPEFERFFRGLPEMKPKGRTQGTGSGFIVSADGYIVTNAHVVEDAEAVTVGLSDKRELPAEVVGVDKLSDIALLKVKAANLPAVQLGNSDGLEVGQWVVAIGAPFGLDHTATQGIVSALSRSLPDGTYVPFIQTDVAVNPGNSGGPLFDLNGNVVGVNSQIYSRSGGYMGISFAIPINVAKNVVDQLKSTGQVSRGWLGVEIQDMNQDLAASFNLNQPNGALVASVQPGSPADKGGIQAGDIITGFGEGRVTSASDLPLLVGNTPVGKQVPVSILRAGSAKTVDVTIDKLASKESGPAKLADAKVEKGMLGVLVSGLKPEELKENKLDNGVMIQDVLSDSPAEEAGLEKGDIIISVNSTPVSSADELKSVVSGAPADKPLAMLVLQGDQTRFIAVNKKL